MSAPTGVGRAYLDYNASAPLRPQARAAVLGALDAPGNASSVHAEGRESRALIEEARGVIGALLAAEPRDVVFTSGATEAANLLLTPELKDAKGGADELWMSAVEHPCVLAGHRFSPEKTRILPVDSIGRLDLGFLERALTEAKGRVMLALQAANNETGVLQPIAEAARLVHARGGLVVCDAVQLAGRGDCRLGALGADVVFISSHKLGGPKGAGAAALASGLLIDAPLVRGGGQERGARGGTENVSAIAGFAAAAQAASLEMATETARLSALRDGMEAALRAKIPDLAIFGAAAARLPNTSALAVGDIGAETLLIALDMAGYAVSSGSACSSGKVKASHVLEAMGIEPHLSRGALRISLGWATSEKDVSGFCETFEITLRDIRARRAGRVAKI